MLKSPLVSILMTCFNRELYLNEAIESVLNSTFRDFEFIIVDDCSTDNSIQIAEKYVKIDNRVKLYVNEKNIGDYKNRNKAASYASGKYLKYLDSDDLIYPYSLQIMLDAIESHPDIGFGFSHINSQDNRFPFPKIYSSKEAYYEEYFNKRLFYAGPGGAIIKRTCFLEVGGFSGKQYVGDGELWLKLAQKYSMVVFQSSLIWWRIHDDQQYNEGENSGKHFKFGFNVFKSALLDENCPLSQELRLKALKKIVRRRSRDIIKKMLFKFNFSQAIQIMQADGIKLYDLISCLFFKII